MAFNEKNYGALLAETLPRVIDSADEYDRVERIFENLLDKAANRTPEEDSLFGLLASLLEDYERQTLAPLPKISPRELLKSLMTEHDLRQHDLAELFGGQSVVSAILSGKREITKEQAKSLATRFKMHITAFL